MILRSRAPWRGIMSQLYVFQAEIISPKQQFGSPPPSIFHLTHVISLNFQCMHSGLYSGLYSKIFQWGLIFFFFQRGLRTQHPLGPENPHRFHLSWRAKPQ